MNTFNVKFDEYYKFIKTIDFFSFKPSLGMKVALKCFKEKAFKLNDDYLELLDSSNACHFEIPFIQRNSSSSSFLKKSENNVSFPVISSEFKGKELQNKINEMKNKNIDFF